MDTFSAVLVALMILGGIQLILVLLFWKFYLSKHLYHPCYKIRDPTFWMISLIGSSIFIIMRCIITYLSVNNKISSITRIDTNQNYEALCSALSQFHAIVNRDTTKMNEELGSLNYF